MATVLLTPVFRLFRTPTTGFTGVDGKVYLIQSSGIGYQNGQWAGKLFFSQPDGTGKTIFSQPTSNMNPNNFFPGGCDLAVVSGSKQLDVHVRDGQIVSFVLTDGDNVLASYTAPVEA